MSRRSLLTLVPLVGWGGWNPGCRAEPGDASIEEAGQGFGGGVRETRRRVREIVFVSRLPSMATGSESLC